MGEIAVNFDSGAIPAVLVTIKESLKMTDVEQGLLGALPYVGLVVACPFIGRLIQRFPPKKVLICSMSGNCVSTLLLALSTNRTELLFLSRFLIGLTQAAFIIYAPVWVDEFAPPHRTTVWMGLTQGATGLGVMFGYLIAGYMRPIGWSYAIFIQCFMLLVITLCLAFCPRKYLEVQDSFSDPIAKVEPSSLLEPSPTGLRSSSLFPSSPSVKYKITNSREIKPAPSDRSDETPPSEMGSDSVRKWLKISDPKNRLDSFSPSISSSKLAPGTFGRSHSEIPFEVTKKRSTKLQYYKNLSQSDMNIAEMPGGLTIPGYSLSSKSDLVPSPTNGFVSSALSPRKTFDNPVSVSNNKTASQNPSPAESLAIEMKLPSTISTIQSVVLLVRCPIYFWVTWTLCALFFVVTGIQFWATRFLEEVIGVKPSVVLPSFCATAATAPMIGVLVGGYVVDAIGGYRTSRGMAKALITCTILAGLATVLGTICGFMSNFPITISLIWLVLFFGAGILPAATGIIIAAVNPRIRSFASGLSMTLYNIFGYVMGTFLPGAVMSGWGLRVGMQVVFSWSALGFVGVLIASIIACRQQKSVRPVRADSSV